MARRKDMPQDILPRRNKADRPLFLVLMIMVFMACLAAIAARASWGAAAGWGADLDRTATVQIKPEASGDEMGLALRAADILKARQEISSAKVLSKDQSRALLRPWLGSAELPEDLPLPMLIDIEIAEGAQLDSAAITASLLEQGIRADVDDHQRWSRDISRTARAMQTLSLLALSLLILGTTATAGYATQAALASRRRIIRVLMQVGARDSYIARLFTRRFAALAITAGFAGALLAIVFTLLFSIMSGKSAGLLPDIGLVKADVVILLLAPLIAGIICAIAAAITVFHVLRTEKIS